MMAPVHLPDGREVDYDDPEQMRREVWGSVGAFLALVIIWLMQTAWRLACDAWAWIGN